MKLRLATAAMIALYSSGAIAQEMVTAADPNRIMTLAQGFGSAKLEVDGEGDPKVTGRIEGTLYAIYFYGCDDHKDCNDIQFYAAWNTGDTAITQEHMTEWNRTKRYGSAYLDEDGDPALKMTVNLKYGVSERNFEDTVDWWAVAVREFKKFMLSK